jgi:hypothetical protein
MKASITQFTKSILADRYLSILLVCLIAVSLTFSVYIALNLHATELQVVTHYSAFGTTNFYRDKWYYLIGFAVFGVIHAVVYVSLVCKILVQKGRQLAIPFAWLGVLIIFIAFAIAHQVLKVASLS